MISATIRGILKRLNRHTDPVPFDRFEAERNGIYRHDHELYRTEQLAKKALKVIPKRSRYWKTIGRYLNDEGVTLHEYLKMRSYLNRITT